MTVKPLFAALAACSLLALGACGSETEGVRPGGDSTQTLATVIASDADLAVVAEMLTETGLKGVFDGDVPYTMFAPTDDAFARFDLPLDGADAGAARVAILREHIVPGFLTMEDITAAIASAGGVVEMQTMGSNTLTFSGDVDELVITSSDGSQARVVDAALSGANGTVFPIDAVLKSLERQQ